MRITALALLLFTSSSYGTVYSVEASLSGNALHVISTDTPRLYIYGVPLNAQCEHQTPVLLLGGEHKNPIAAEMYSALLMAKASSKKITIQSTHCWEAWSTPVITSIYIQD